MSSEILLLSKMKKHDVHSKLVYISFLWAGDFFLSPLLCSDIPENLYSRECNEERTWEKIYSGRTDSRI